MGLAPKLDSPACERTSTAFSVIKNGPVSLTRRKSLPSHRLSSTWKPFFGSDHSIHPQASQDLTRWSPLLSATLPPSPVT